MDVPHSTATALAAARFRLRRLTRKSHSPNAPRELGPIFSEGRRVVLREPRLSDGATWRALRLRDRHLIEPYWVSSDTSWEQRHTEAAWVDECLRLRRARRAGTAAPFVIEVNGRLAGQLNLEHIDPHAGSAEIGVWLSATESRRGLTTQILRNLLMDYAFDELNLFRLTAPVCVDNTPAAHCARCAGLHREGTMTGFLDVGGTRKDHDLWAITAPEWAAQKQQAAPGPVPAADRAAPRTATRTAP